jgi:hypothetical protein
MNPRLRSFWILFGAWLVVIAYSFPGFMNWDAGEQLFQARTGQLDDWYPPVMGAYWKLLDMIVAGPLLMLVLQVSLFLWGLYALLRTRLDERLAAPIAAALMLFPPILTPMSAVWKDAQMAGFLIAGVALALRPGRRARALGLAGLFMAAAVRDNAAFALPPLCLVICGTWGFRRRVVAFAVAAAVCIGLVGASVMANKMLTQSRAFPWFRSVALHDIGGTICNADPMSDQELTELLDGTGHVEITGIRDRLCGLYTPLAWFSMSQGEQHYFNDRYPRLLKSERMARRRAWWQLVSEHPRAYLAHRAAVMQVLLGLHDGPMWEPVCHDVNANTTHGPALHHNASLSGFQRALMAIFDVLGRTLLFRPWAYAVLSLIFFGYALARRDRLLLGLLGSGLLYEASYFVLAAAPDYRYSHWMIVCCVVSGVLIAARRGNRSPSRAPC